MRITTLGPGDIGVDPGYWQDSIDDLISALQCHLEEARDLLKIAEQALDAGSVEACKSAMKEAAGWLTEEA